MAHVRSYTLQHADVCQNSGRQLQCTGNEVLHIQDVLCLPSNYTCPERDKILWLCEGERSCASIGLKQQLLAYCQNAPARTVIISFKCTRKQPLPACRTNICSHESEGLHCGNGNQLHIVRARCSHGQEECPWNVYQTLYTLCEGRKSCYASGLSRLMPGNTCTDNFVQTANVFVDYICVEEDVTDGVCTGNVRSMPKTFGIIKSPGFPYNPEGNPNSCYWAIYPKPGRVVEIIIHLAFSREYTETCSAQFLQVTYRACGTYRKITDTFCKAQDVNIERKSCGTVYIRSSSYLAGEDRGNRFLVTYQVKEKYVSDPSYTKFMKQCHSGFELANVTSAVPYTSVSEKSPPGKRSRELNIVGQQYAAFYRNSESQPAVAAPLNTTGQQNFNDTGGKSTFHPWRFLTIVKVVVINVFLFIIAVSLVIAIVYVCYRYKQVDKAGRYNLAPQSDTDSGRRTTTDTPLQTFSEDLGITPPRGSSMHSFTRDQSQVYASLAEDPYATVGDDPDYPTSSYSNSNQQSRDNQMSSFRPKPSNPYASYDSLDYDVPAEIHERSSSNHVQNPYMNGVATHSAHNSPVHLQQSPYHTPDHMAQTYQNPEEEFPPPPENLQNFDATAHGGPVQHYTINDDDYAIVQKPKKMTSSNPVNARSSPSNHSQQCASPSHFTRGDVGYHLPQHDCMLTCNVPPFSPPHRQNGTTPNHDRANSGPTAWEDGFY
ncbi:uncharacterized protein LOC110460996 isoform X2 [Mizuhopecten yessoensis]|uniref:uncharacterized protein LOC110460996 isoform X2 n=1 Tax=Mizuhopecten yessoensis TaxID=6573 RepID=UPI000B45BFD3|nr:uncharacterized protein LOC110460996 isoform X2 [Mizuhopecten yessoensis]